MDQQITIYSDKYGKLKVRGEFKVENSGARSGRYVEEVDITDIVFSNRNIIKEISMKELNDLRMEFLQRIDIDEAIKLFQGGCYA